jgi:hypothetical protein
VGEAPYVVAVVVDPAFGERLRELPPGVPVWVADTPANRAAAQRLWRGRRERTHLDGVTTFEVEPGRTPAEWCAAVLGQVDLHHGEYSHAPPYAAVEVIGAEPTAELRAALAQYGLTEVTPRPGGFRASTVAPAS